MRWDRVSFLRTRPAQGACAHNHSTRLTVEAIKGLGRGSAGERRTCQHRKGSPPRWLPVERASCQYREQPSCVHLPLADRARCVAQGECGGGGHADGVVATRHGACTRPRSGSCDLHVDAAGAWRGGRGHRPKLGRAAYDLNIAVARTPLEACPRRCWT
jgi:hypothetical protein